MDIKQIGKYEILRKIGEGGFGSVFLATNTKLKRDVALKVLHPQVASDQMLAAYFEREAHALARLDHVNIVRVYDYDQIDGVSFIVMEYVDGTTLDRLLREGRSFSVSETRSIFRQLLAALGYAHGRGVIHRDIKPSNIMLTKSDEVKITDFGIAKVAGSAKLTRTGTGAGSLLYMSPEQVRGQGVDNRSDLYSAGITLYQVATGHTPFESDSDYEIMNGHLERKPPPPSQFVSTVPRDLEQVILKSLEKIPEKRYQSAAEMSDALQGIQMSDDRTIPLTRKIEGEIPTALPTPFPPPRPVGKRRWPLMVGAAVVVVAVVAWFAFKGGGNGDGNIASFSDSLTAATSLYNEEKYNDAATAFALLAQSASGTEEEKIKIQQHLAAAKLLTGDSLSARSTIEGLYRHHPELQFSPETWPPRITEIWRELGEQRTVPQLGSIEVNLQDYEAFAPVTISCGNQSKVYQGQTVSFTGLAAGKHEIRVAGSAMKTIREVVQIDNNRVERTFTPEKLPPPPSGTLSVVIENYKIFEPVTVTFDGKSETYRGVPLVFANLASRSYEVSVATDLGRLVDQVTIQGDSQATVFRLNENSESKLTVSSLVAGSPEEIVPAQVYIDNQKIEDGQTPFSTKLLGGPHKVWVEHPDYQTEGRPRFIDLNKDMQIEFVLRKK